MRFCHKCGAEIASGVRFCRSCGAAVVAEVASAPSEPVVSEPSANDAAFTPLSAAGVPATATPPVTPSPSPPAALSSTGSSAPFRILPSQYLLAGLLLAGILAGAYVLVSNQQDSNKSGVSAIPHGEVDNHEEQGEGVGQDSSNGTDESVTSEEDGRSQCLSNLRAIGLAAQQYVQDHDEKFPVASMSDSPAEAPDYDPPYGWADALYPYTKSTKYFQCPTEPQPANASPTNAGFTDYYLNSLVEGHNASEFSFFARTILAGDGSSGNARYSRSTKEGGGMPSGSHRHLDGANYLFLDGHVKWLRPESVGSPNDAVEQNNYTHATGIIVSPGIGFSSAPDSTVRSSSTPTANFVGEHFPETRTRALTGSDIQNWSYAKVRYAINEIYARGGYAFKSAPIRRQFDRFSWYRPVAGLSQPQIESRLSPQERSNLHVLAKRRSQLGAAP